MCKEGIDIKNIVRKKGWTLKALGVRWDGITVRQMSRVINNPNKKTIDAVEGLPERIELKINRHPSGRLTLSYKSSGATKFSDYMDKGLFANLDEASFNLAFEQKINALKDQGYELDIAHRDK